MRLIDADALIAQWESDAEEMEEIAFKLATYSAINDVKHQPTIEPRKKGKWIKMSDADGDYYVCDQCGEELPRYTTEPATWGNLYPPKYSVDKTDFCPHCGADMRGGEDEQT